MLYSEITAVCSQIHTKHIRKYIVWANWTVEDKLIINELFSSKANKLAVVN
jgi:hypothetical protein